MLTIGLQAGAMYGSKMSSMETLGIVADVSLMTTSFLFFLKNRKLIFFIKGDD